MQRAAAERARSASGAGKCDRQPIERAQMQKLVEPVMASYAKEIGADAIYAKILAVK